MGGALQQSNMASINQMTPQQQQHQQQLRLQQQPVSMIPQGNNLQIQQQTMQQTRPAMPQQPQNQMGTLGKFHTIHFCFEAFIAYVVGGSIAHAVGKSTLWLYTLATFMHRLGDPI